MDTTTIEITTPRGHKITATLSDDGERVKIRQDGTCVSVARVDYHRGQIFDCSARLGAADGSEDALALIAIGEQLPRTQIAHGLTLREWCVRARCAQDAFARINWLAGVDPLSEVLDS